MHRSTPFVRAKMMLAAIAGIMANSPVHLQHGLIGALGPYKSRGKGKGLYSTARSGTHAQAIRAAKKARNISRNRAAHR